MKINVVNSKLKRDSTSAKHLLALIPKFMESIRALTISVCLIFLCSCSTPTDWRSDDAIRPPLPPEISFNKTAGRGDHLFVMLRLDDGKELRFAVDTGMPFTILDKSLESKLGKRLRAVKLRFGWLGGMNGGAYQSPKLNAGNTELMIGDEIRTADLSTFSDPGLPLMGILGMDCLRHYCVQMDFAAGKMRFLDPDQLDEENLGKAFSITISWSHAFVLENLLGVKGAKTLIDTGECDDGALSAKLFERELQNRKQTWVREGSNDSDRKIREACFTNGAFGGETYTNLILKDSASSNDSSRNIIGLRFLARHLVTFNFPKRTMYLQRTGDEPQADWTDGNASYALTMEAVGFLMSLKEKAQLPGWSKDDRGDVTDSTPPKENTEVYPMYRTFIATKTGDVSKYHYIIVKPSKDSALKLHRAWRTDEKEHLIEEYPVP